MTRYELFDELEKILELKQTEEHYYNKMIISGELSKSHFDYDTGFYDVSMFYQKVSGKHVCRVWFGTRDDGDFGSWNDCNTKEEALELLSKVVEKFKNIIVCPSHEELNLEFRTLGVYFCHE